LNQEKDWSKRKGGKKEIRERKEKRLSFFLILVLLGGIGGGVLGEILKVTLPEGKFREVITQGWEVYLKPVEINLAILSINFGFGLKITLLSLVFMFLAGWLYFKAR